MEGRVGPLRLSVNPKTKNVRKHPAVNRKIVVLDDLFCMMEEIITGLALDKPDPSMRDVFYLNL
jgi:hypothetical protein